MMMLVESGACLVTYQLPTSLYLICGGKYFKKQATSGINGDVYTDFVPQRLHTACPSNGTCKQKEYSLAYN